MQEFLLYRADDGAPIQLDDLAALIAAIPGVVLGGADGDAYRPGRFRDAATGAACTLDLGAPPLEEDDLHPPRAYPGWVALGVTVQLPLAGPHWFAVECLRLVEAILERVPGARALDTEDTQAAAAAEDGPFPWSRPRAIAGWERLRTIQLAGRSDVYRMERGDSLRLWRYRRERAAAAAVAADCQWPDAAVLAPRTGRRAQGAALWADPARPFALPPVPLVVVVRDGVAGVLDTAALLAAAGTTDTLGAGAVRIAPTPAVAALRRDAALRPATGYAALADDEWAD